MNSSTGKSPESPTDSLGCRILTDLDPGIGKRKLAKSQ